MTNSQNIAVNAAAIDVNRGNIAGNSSPIDQAFTQIDANSDRILQNIEEISELSEGLAAVAALPDMYLSPGAKWATSGGAAVYGGDVGFGATIAIRGNDNWAFGASGAIGGDQATGKVQIRYEGF